MNQATVWWLENTAAGRRTQRQMLPESALMPRARAEAREEREERERREHESRCVMESRHLGDHVFPTRKPILDRMQDGEFREHESVRQGKGFAVPGVSVPGNRPRCRARRRP
jgi:hypothetical protein